MIMVIGLLLMYGGWNLMVESQHNESVPFLFGVVLIILGLLVFGASMDTPMMGRAWG